MGFRSPVSSRANGLEVWGQRPLKSLAQKGLLSDVLGGLNDHEGTSGSVVGLRRVGKSKGPPFFLVFL